MRITEALVRRAEQALNFDPREERRRLLDRTAIAVADAPTLRRRIVQALGEGADAAQLAVDRLVGATDQLNVSYLERGMIAADAVAWIEVRDGESTTTGFATGFMISPRLLLTNHHVLPTADDAAQSWLHFRHEFDALGRALEPCDFALDPSAFFWTDPELDTTIVAVAPETPDRRQRVSAFGWLRLSSSQDLALPGEWLTAIHHPGGAPKQVALRQNLLIDTARSDLWYVTETAAASSGAPLFNDSWQVVGVHRAGVPARDHDGAILTLDGEAWHESIDESRIVWRAGIGTRTATILETLIGSCGDHPLVAEVRSDSDADAADAIIVPLGAGVERGRAGEPANLAATPAPAIQPVVGAIAAVPQTNGRSGHDIPLDGDALTVTVPLRITVRGGNSSGTRPAVGVDLS
jgi:endonuclease G, mitochondrial